MLLPASDSQMRFQSIRGSCTSFLKFMNFSQFSGKNPKKVGKSGGKWHKSRFGITLKA